MEMRFIESDFGCLQGDIFELAAAVALGDQARIGAVVAGMRVSLDSLAAEASKA